MRRALLLTLALLFASLPSKAGSPPGFKVIAHPQVAGRTLSNRDVSDMFMKRTTSWADGSHVKPVDLLVTASTREAFSRAVHGKSARAVKTQWSQIIFTGQGTPPPEVASDAKVLEFVLSTPGAIGYVSGDFPTGAARVLTVEE
jgi:ABC-type phosphate transport system substrate-binding protein